MNANNVIERSPHARRHKKAREAEEFISSRMHCTCLTEGCQADIRPDCRILTIDKTNPVKNTGTIQAWCPDCDAMFKSRVVLQMGIWSAVGEVERILDVKRRTAIRTRIEELRGVMQRMAS